MKNIIIADNQDITQAGMAYVLSKRDNISCRVARNKSELILLLSDCPEAVVILDYTLFDISSESDLLNIGQRFPLAHLILWSEELSVDFIRSLVNASNWISVLMKDAKMAEIEQCLDYVLQGQRFLCQHATNMILAPTVSVDNETVALTKTETEILKEIALGATTREIAEKRFSSFHTVNTHRKNIFRKLGVNNVHEAIRYAMRSGLVDAAEYYI
ncbi:helix-turn-helix transcriptional regulator [Prevotella sp.]|jgi:transcriptional regulator|uniref:helix-turn-helix transcriptional regulator n=1 Tax=Prevotella sp. TaxID=59823 RepID=UPI001CB1D750|nr:response regulator transcription factor [Prevotella sp.]MBF1595903.1 response regulator transcription factor [Prevotella sp.]